MFSQTVEYALRAMVQLAYTSSDGCSTDVLAQSTQVPRAYLSKVLQGLRRAGLVRSQRGIGGGVYLERPPEQISILEVINAVEPVERILTCPLGLKSHGSRLCPLHAKVDSAIALIQESFCNTTLADIIATGTYGSRPLCESPTPAEPQMPSFEK